MSAPEQITPVSGPHKGRTGILNFRYSDGGADVQFFDIAEQPVHFIPYEDMPPTFAAYAWPGGYPIAYYPLSDSGDLDGSVLCPDCAKTEYHAWEPGNEYDPDPPRFHAEIEEEVHNTIYCDGCSQPFIFQNWCDFCQDSVDVGEDTPHVCRPLKWQLITNHRAGNLPSIHRFATREQARNMARSYRRSGYQFAAVSPIHPPITPE